MATTTVIPISEYLKTMYYPDCDYVDGHIEERNLGELDHGELQAQLLQLLRTSANKRYFTVTPELRIQVSPTRFRIPDFCIRSASAPREQIIRTPPLLCIEVLSPEDTLPRMKKRIQDYFDMGVPELWIVDPATRAIHLCTKMTIAEQASGDLTVPCTPVTLAIADIFSVLDEV